MGFFTYSGAQWSNTCNTTEITNQFLRQIAQLSEMVVNASFTRVNKLTFRVVQRGWMVKALTCGTDSSRFKSHHALKAGPHPLLA